MSAGLQSNDFDLEFVRIGCRGLAAAVRDEALGWVRALREVMGELDAQTMQVMVPSASNAPMHSSVGWAWCWLQNLWLLHLWRAVSCLLFRHYHNASRSLACDTALGHMRANEAGICSAACRLFCSACSASSVCCLWQDVRVLKLMIDMCRDYGRTCLHWTVGCAALLRILRTSKVF